MRALGSGKHVFVEKPLSMDAYEAQRIASMARDAGLKIAVGHIYLYHPYLNELRRAYRAGEFGDLVYLVASG